MINEDGIRAPRTLEEFFPWCATLGLVDNKDISRAFGRTPQTIENWRRGHSRSGMPRIPAHLTLSCVGYEALRRETGMFMPSDPPLTATMFRIWCSYYGLRTLSSVAEVFGVTRQAVHNWGVRGRLPKWLNMACHGHAHIQNALYGKADGVARPRRNARISA